MGVDEAIAALRAGKPIIVFDSGEREREADLMVHAQFAGPDKIELLRKDGGGLICLATDRNVAEKLSLPFLTDFYSEKGNETLKKIVYNKTQYGDKPSFSITINHNDTYTGITDDDRSMTAREFAKLTADAQNGKEIREKFERDFKAPGHLHLLIGKTLAERKGHTELALELCRRAKLPPAMLLCEMLGKGKALSVEQAREYAKKNGIPFVVGRELL
ncbi:3,4-dihydroxy-2-butanone 4-phosphate synthase [Candidatus Gugararchaeum adminiculabundum]|nr:3,4-dihydroxy-2-butanone 4-phosphate synthase [Candidatus Gugararchaeum adminiculabundum]